MRITSEVLSSPQHPYSSSPPYLGELEIKG